MVSVQDSNHRLRESGRLDQRVLEHTLRANVHDRIQTGHTPPLRHPRARARRMAPLRFQPQQPRRRSGPGHHRHECRQHRGKHQTPARQLRSAPGCHPNNRSGTDPDNPAQRTVDVARPDRHPGRRRPRCLQEHGARPAQLRENADVGPRRSTHRQPDIAEERRDERVHPSGKRCQEQLLRICHSAGPHPSRHL